MKEKLIYLSTQKPKLVFWLLAFLTFAIGALITKIQIDTDPENMLPETQSERMYHNDVKQRFRLYDVIVVGTVNTGDQGVFNPKSLSALHKLSEEILKIDGVIDVDLMSLSTVDNITQEQQGAIRFEWMMKKVPDSDESIKQLSANIDRLPLLQNTLVSEDNKATAIYVPIENKDESYRISQDIETIIATLESEDDYHITGLPVAEDTFGFQMFVQMGISAPLAALMIFVLMWVFFRNLKFIAAPMIIAMSTVIITMGLMIGMGHTVHIMSSMIPIFLMPIAVVDSIHIMSEFSDTYKQGDKPRDVVTKVVGHLYKPMLFTSVTSAIGFASLMLTPIPPVQVFGAYVAFGIFLAFLLTIIFIPAYVVSLKPSSLNSLLTVEDQDSKLQSLLRSLGKGTSRHSFLIITSFLVVLAVSLWGVTKIQINDNPVRWFKPDHKIRVADKVLNEHFAGTYDAYLVLEANTSELNSRFTEIIASLEESEFKSQLMNKLQDENQLSNQLNLAVSATEDHLFDMDYDSEDPEIYETLMTSLEQLQTQLKQFQQPQSLHLLENIQAELVNSGHVGKSNSLADVVKVVNRELRSGKESDYAIPDSQNGVAQALLQYQSSHRPGDLWHMVTKDYSSTAIWIQLKSGDNQDMTAVVDFIDNYFKNNPLPENIKAKWAGKTYLNKVWQEEMVAGMIDSLMGAFVVVLIMMIVLFRSLVFGILAMLPLTLTISFIYGLIGWVGKDYDMPIAVLSALTLGLSVDFAIHFLQRAREIYAENNSFQSTMELMFTEPASAISRNAIVIAIGFTPLLFAPLVPYITVGFFLASIMAVSALVTLLMLPAALKVVKRWAFR